MKCKYCGSDLIKLDTADEYVCSKCSITYDGKEIRYAKEAELIEEDMEYWRSAQKFR